MPEPLSQLPFVQHDCLGRAPGHRPVRARARSPTDCAGHRYDQGNLHSAASDKAEAEFVVRALEALLAGHSFFSVDSGRARLHHGADLSFRDVAVLYRTGAEAAALIDALQRSGMPFVCHDHSLTAGEAADADTRADRIALLTLHAAKGLEFEVVFIVGCEDGIIPLSFGPKTSDIAEERRLFFVGLTRARCQLILTHAHKRLWRGKVRPMTPSPFLRDIAAALLERNSDAARARPRARAKKQMDLF